MNYTSTRHDNTTPISYKLIIDNSFIYLHGRLHMDVNFYVTNYTYRQYIDAVFHLFKIIEVNFLPRNLFIDDNKHFEEQLQVPLFEVALVLSLISS